MSNRIAKHTNFFKIDVYLIPAKCACFLIGLHMGSYIPFLNVFFTSVGFSKFQAGIVTGLRNVLPIITGPLWGYLADRTGRRKFILFVMCTGASLPLFTMPWFAARIYPRSQFNCNSSSTNVTYEKCLQDKETALMTLFHTFIGLMTLASFFLQPLPYFFNTIVIDAVMARATDSSYGKQWVFTTIGMSLGNFLSGKASDHFNKPDMSPYTEIFYIFLPCTLLFFPLGCFIINQINNQEGASKPRPKKDQYEEIVPDLQKDQQEKECLVKQVCDQLRRFDVMFFMLTVLVSGIASNVFTNFSYVLVSDIMKGKSKGDTSLIITTATLSSVFILPFTSTVIKVMRGTYPAIILGTFTYFIRFIVMSHEVPFYVFIAVQMLSALSYALSWTAFIDHLTMIAPKAISTTMNSLMFTVFSSVGSLIANIGGGMLYERYGGRELFFMESILCLTWTLVMIVYLTGRYFTRMVRGRTISMEDVHGCRYGYMNDAFKSLHFDRESIRVNALFSNTI